jgi:serine/threonine-protein kinase
MADTAYFIVMEYVDGANLKTILESLRRQTRRMPVGHVLYIMMEICKGLHYAHEATDPESGRELHIVHRDISPPNILISKNGEVKLVDFGLAKATSQLESTDPGVVKGKFSYLSPEAASGKEVDRRADIFAVGILLYELLTGKRLFYGETDYQTVELVRQAKVPAIAPQNADVTPELEQIIRKSLARDLSARFQTAADLQDSLAQYLFSQRHKVTYRDILQLVRSCLEEKQRSQPKESKPVNLIDELINEEIVKFTSLDDMGDGAPVDDMRSPSPTPNDGGAPLDPGSFVDTRGWVDDLAEVSKPNPRNGAPMSKAHRPDSGELPALEVLLEGDEPSSPPSPPPKPRTMSPPPSASRASSPQLNALRNSGAQTALATAEPRSSSATAPAKVSSARMTVLLVVALLLLGGAGAAFFLLRGGGPAAQANTSQKP